MITTVSDGKSAVEAYRRILPEFVVMDAVLPVMSGFKACHQIMKFNPQAHVILYSALHDDSFTSKAYFNGAVDFLIKPMSEEVLLQSIQGILSILSSSRRVKRFKLQSGGMAAPPQAQPPPNKSEPSKSK